MDSSAHASSRWKRRIYLAAKWLGLIAVVGYVAYRFTSSPIEVKAHLVQRGEITSEVMGTGTFEARTKVIISPRISGRVAEVLVDQGDRVVAGQLLVRLDDEDLTQQVRIAESTIELSKASRGRFKADRDQAESVLIQARSEYERAVELAKSDSISQSETDKAREALDVATAGVARAEAAMIEAEQQILLAERTLAFQQARLTDGKMLAPFDGLIIERYRDPGAIAVPGTSVLSMVSTDELWVAAWVDETAMASLAEGQPARVIFRSESATEYAGRVARLGRQADRETREFVVEVRVLDLPKNWAVGQRAEVYIQIDTRPDAVLVPQEFLLKQDGIAGVYVHRDGRATWQPIDIGLVARESVEAVHGLQSGDELVVPSGPGQVTLDSRRVIKR